MSIDWNLFLNTLQKSLESVFIVNFVDSSNLQDSTKFDDKVEPGIFLRLHPFDRILEAIRAAQMQRPILVNLKLKELVRNVVDALASANPEKFRAIQQMSNDPRIMLSKLMQFELSDIIDSLQRTESMTSAEGFTEKNLTLKSNLF